VSEKGNLFASLLITEPLPLRAGAQLSFAAGLAAAECAAAYAHPVTLKWPNDVLLSGRKLGGILLESSGSDDMLIVGIGLNLALCPADTEFPATSIADMTGRAPSPEAAINQLTAAWERWFSTWRRSGFVPLREAWLARASGLGDKIVARTGESEMHGIFEDLDEHGVLMLRRADGVLCPIHAADIFFDGSA
jgi:BirA family biotin operon repressor/biotin-[acetyl-CoA-carboxylase] ligase